MLPVFVVALYCIHQSPCTDWSPHFPHPKTSGIHIDIHSWPLFSWGVMKVWYFEMNERWVTGVITWHHSPPLNQILAKKMTSLSFWIQIYLPTPVLCWSKIVYITLNHKCGFPLSIFRSFGSILPWKNCMRIDWGPDTISTTSRSANRSIPPRPIHMNTHVILHFRGRFKIRIQMSFQIHVARRASPIFAPDRCGLLTGCHLSVL